MDVALECAQCRAPAQGSQFCTTCGFPLAGDAGDVVAQPAMAAWTESAAGSPVRPAPSAPWLAAGPLTREPQRRRNVLALVVLGALALSAWAILHGVEQHTLSGTVSLVDASDGLFEPGDSCVGLGGYSDVSGGARVVVVDQKGATLSTGRLSDGHFDGLGCAFSFALENVPRADFYGLRIAGSARGELQYSYDEFRAQDWFLQLSLGDD